MQEASLTGWLANCRLRFVPHRRVRAGPALQVAKRQELLVGAKDRQRRKWGRNAPTNSNVTPAKAGVQTWPLLWITASAAMTRRGLFSNLCYHF